MEQRTIISSYRNLLIEQDERSPHRYVQDVNRLHGKILFDIGAAEGLFTLMCIEQVKYAYLFECETEWIEPLNLTFAPYKDKISIVRKYISDKNDEQNITIDLFLEDKDKSNLFLKMDIEGNEQAALRGAVKTLTDAKEIDFSICTYHRKNDAAEIADILASYGLKYEFTDGLIYYQKSFRKGIIRSKV